MKGYKPKISSPVLCLNASIFDCAGEKVLDSIAIPAIAILGRSPLLDVLLSEHEEKKNKAIIKRNMKRIVVSCEKILKIVNKLREAFAGHLFQFEKHQSYLSSIAIIQNCYYKFEHWRCNNLIFS
jgi:hypothetical protein